MWERSVTNMTPGGNKLKKALPRIIISHGTISTDCRDAPDADFPLLWFMTNTKLFRNILKRFCNIFKGFYADEWRRKLPL